MKADEMLQRLLPLYETLALADRPPPRAMLEQTAFYLATALAWRAIGPVLRAAEAARREQWAALVAAYQAAARVLPAILVLLFVACGEGAGGDDGAGGSGPAAEAPLCEPPPMVCENGEPTERDRGDGVIDVTCPRELGVDTVYLRITYRGQVMSYFPAEGAGVACWPPSGGRQIVAAHSKDGVSFCYDQGGAPADCAEVSEGLDPAWGF